MNESMATVYVPRFRGLSSHRRVDMEKPIQTSEIMQIDGAMGCATALMEMLVHEQGGVVKIFPGVPDDWKDASFERIRLGRLRVSAVREGGRTVRWSLFSPTEQEVVVEAWPGSRKVVVHLRPGVLHTVEPAGDD